MTPQDNFLVLAPIRPDRARELRGLLAGMNASPGMANPSNDCVPFAMFRTLHTARFFILDDKTTGDLAAYGRSFLDPPIYLAFMGDCDGAAGIVLADLAQRAAAGLARIFACCYGYDTGMDLLAWMRRHRVKSAATYVNMPGRTVRQILDEAALHAALLAYLSAIPANAAPEHIHANLRQAVAERGPRLSPPGPTPLLYWRRLSGEVCGVLVLAVGAALLLLTPLILLLPLFLLWLRHLEKTDPVIAERPPDEEVRALASLEDYDQKNPFSAIGSVKPGWFRWMTLRVVLFALDVFNRVVYAHGHLARIGTIHFARWVFLDGGRRLLFASTYDHSLQTYADDFVNKVAFGINLVFGNGLGFPRTKLLLGGGASNERLYRHYQRRHQVPDQVWYTAYPGLTTFEIGRNARIRQGLERERLDDAALRQWLALI